MMQQLYPLIWITFIICVFLVWFFSHRARQKERLMLIERGANVEELAKTVKKFRFPWLKLGIVILGISIGLLIISLLVNLNMLEKGGDALPVAILGICGGISMVIANFLKSGDDKQ